MSELIVQNRPAEHVEEMQHAKLAYTPRFDIWEDENAYHLAGDMPGVAPDQLDIQYENHELRLWGRVAPRQQGIQYWSEEYGVGDFYRSFSLGEAIDAEEIAAILKDGVLTLTLPKHASVRPRRISVKAA